MSSAGNASFKEIGFLDSGELLARNTAPPKLLSRFGFEDPGKAHGMRAVNIIGGIAVSPETRGPYWYAVAQPWSRRGHASIIGRIILEPAADWDPDRQVAANDVMPTALDWLEQNDTWSGYQQVTGLQMPEHTTATESQATGVHGLIIVRPVAVTVAA